MTKQSDLKKEVWKVFSKYIRLKYANEFGMVRCYTCGALMRWQDAQAGHGIPGRNNSILFDEEIVRPQCKRCNIFLNGNEAIFHYKLIKENGLDWFEKKLKQKQTIKQFSNKELQDLYDYYSDKVRKLGTF